jgi:hypothetical protein
MRFRTQQHERERASVPQKGCRNAAQPSKRLKAAGARTFDPSGKKRKAVRTAALRGMPCQALQWAQR